VVCNSSTGQAGVCLEIWLSTVDLPLIDMGGRAVERLSQSIEAEHEEAQTIQPKDSDPPGLVVRESSGVRPE